MIRTPFFLFIFFYLTLCNATLSDAQSLYYDIVKGGKTVGSMTVSRKVEGEKMTYKISSRTAIRMVFMVRVNYDLVEHYENGTLIGGESKSTLNGALQKQTTITRYPDKYKFELSSDVVYLHQDKIEYSIPEIYFAKPQGTVKVFSQVFAEYLDYKQVNDNTWILYSEDGKNTSSYNREGICELVKISRTYANFSLVLNKEKSDFNY